MCPFYNAQLFEITGAAKGVFTHSQSSCHIAKVVLTIRHDSRQIPIASDARPFHTSCGFLVWALSRRRFDRSAHLFSFVSFFVRSESHVSSSRPAPRLPLARTEAVKVGRRTNPCMGFVKEA